jgi:hypothetical protein
MQRAVSLGVQRNNRRDLMPGRFDHQADVANQPCPGRVDDE